MASELNGVKELTRKLNQIDARIGVKVLRSSIFKATTPVVRQMKARIPVGNEAHRTYKGRLVGPGFAKRSIKRVTGKRLLSQGKLSIAIGVRAEAFYAVQFYDQGPYTITQRRYSTSARHTGGAARGKHIVSTRNIKPYTIKRRPWFVSTFISNESAMLSSISRNLKTEIEKVTKNG